MVWRVLNLGRHQALSIFLGGTKGHRYLLKPFTDFLNHLLVLMVARTVDIVAFFILLAIRSRIQIWRNGNVYVLHFLELNQRLVVLGEDVQFLDLGMGLALVQRGTRARSRSSCLVDIHEESNRSMCSLLDQSQNEVVKDMPELKPLDTALDDTELAQGAVILLLILLLRQMSLHMSDQAQVYLLQFPVDLLDLFIQIFLIVIWSLPCETVDIEQRLQLAQIDVVIRYGDLHVLVVFENSRM